MLKQSLQQKLLQKLSPQQIQLMKLLQVPAMGLEQRIKEELEMNPALEEGPDEFEDEGKMTEEEELMANTPGEEDYNDNENKREDFSLDEYIDDDEIPNYKLQVKNTGPDDEQREVPLSGSISFHDNLIQQLGLRELSDQEYQIGLVLIGNIDDDGYLRRDIDLVSDDLAFSQNIHAPSSEVEKILHGEDFPAQHTTPESNLKYYIRYHEKIMENIKNVIVLDFYKFTEDFSYAIEKIKKHIGIEPSMIVDKKDIFSTIFEKEGDMYTPRDNKQELLYIKNKVILDPFLEKANDIYKSIISISESQDQ